jgi:hypothetical protein
MTDYISNVRSYQKLTYGIGLANDRFVSFHVILLDQIWSKRIAKNVAVLPDLGVGASPEKSWRPPRGHVTNALNIVLRLQPVRKPGRVL